MKLNYLLISGFLVIALLVGVVGYTSVTQSKKILQKEIGEGSVLLAQETVDKIDRNILHRIEEFQAYSKDLSLQEAIIKSNQEFAAILDVQKYIDQKDQEWISVPGEEITPFMQELMSNELSEELREKIEFYEEKYGYAVFGEAFVTNNYGANVAQTGKTSDYYQADEEWWQVAKTGYLYMGDVGYDESADVYSTDIGIR
ncbi:MAG: hypothetical protein ABIA37_04345, partial [Candidatus Woesearchaeota archaeon]